MDKIEELLTRGVDSIYPSKEELEKILRSGKKLKLYQGFDPTGTHMHIGHMIGLRKLAQWQRLGHEVIFLIGDGTGQAGDPSGKTKSREKFLTREELRENAKDYVMQAGKIVAFEGDNPVKILYNGDWLNKLTLVDILDIAGRFSVQQMVERGLFQDRMKRGEPINLREFLYPLLQAYDSVAMQVDLEVGGTDQTFNMLCGRTLVKTMLHKDKFVMTTPLLADSAGRKIGKTEGNAITLTDKPNDLFAKIMALPDDILIKGFEYLTDLSMQEISIVEEESKQKDKNPMEFKKKLAFEIVEQLHSESDAEKAQEHFEKTVQNKEFADGNIPIRSMESGATILDALAEFGFASSKSEAKRLVVQRAALLNNEVITNPNHMLPKGESVLRVGGRRFGKIKIGD